MEPDTAPPLTGVRVCGADAVAKVLVSWLFGLRGQDFRLLGPDSRSVTPAGWMDPAHRCGEADCGSRTADPSPSCEVDRRADRSARHRTRPTGSTPTRGLPDTLCVPSAALPGGHELRETRPAPRYPLLTQRRSMSGSFQHPRCRRRPPVRHDAGLGLLPEPAYPGCVKWSNGEVLPPPGRPDCALSSTCSSDHEVQWVKCLASGNVGCIPPSCESTGHNDVADTTATLWSTAPMDRYPGWALGRISFGPFNRGET